MSVVHRRGFTVIETMLFLAISGVLAIAILASSGAAINQQRYRDSVNSLKALIQTQYSETANPVNDRDDAWKCNGLGVVTDESSPSSQQFRGTSECVVMGRAITADASGTNLSVATIIARLPAGSTTASTGDIDAFRQYRYSLSPINALETSPEWGTTLVKPGGSSPDSFSIFIVRSPLSGLVRTFIANNVANVDTVMTSGALATNDERILCVNGNSFFAGPRLGVRIRANAGSQSAIETTGDGVC